jgi:STE24 endopeptidase
MKWAIAVGAAIYLALFVTTTFIHSPEAEARAARYFTQTEIDNGLQFTLERRLLMWAETGLHLALWTWIVCSGFARRLTDVFDAWTGRRWLLTLLLVGVFCYLVQEALYLPFGIARWMVVRDWGLSNLSLAGWLVEHTKGLAVSVVISGCMLLGFYGLVRFFPRAWWLLATLAALAFGVVLAFLLPLVVAPLFNTFTPLAESEWAHLRRPVQALIDRAGISVDGIFVVDASRQSSHTNAYFTGFGPTRRIVLYDTLLKKHSLPEVESILAHEIGHWRHNHIVKGLSLAAGGALLGFLLLSVILCRAVGSPPARLTGPGDPAGLPLILLLWTLASWVAMPVQNAISREFERQADAYSLELAGQPEAFIEAEKQLARVNVLNVAPTPWNVWLFASHPPVVERIEMAEEWRKRHAERR